MSSIGNMYGIRVLLAHAGVAIVLPFGHMHRFNPTTNHWDKGLPHMSVGRHGQYPVVGPAPNASPGSEPVVWVCGGSRSEQSDIGEKLCTYMNVAREESATQSVENVPTVEHVGTDNPTQTRTLAGTAVWELQE